MRGLNRLLLTAAIGALAVGSAQAADVVYPAPAPAPVVVPQPQFSWAGAYVGGTIGYTWNDADVDNLLFEGTPAPVDPFGIGFDGIIGGGTVGFNAQWGQIVAGVEGDFSFSDAEGSIDNPDAAFTATTRLNWLATVRGRIGFAFDRALIYGTGGLAFADIEAQLDDEYDGGATILTSTDSNTFTGWTAGGGVEFAVTNNWTIKGEYLYYDLGSQTYTFNEPSPPGYDEITVDADVTGSLVRLGANFKF